MERREFLIALASVPIAALAPWPKLLPLTDTNWNMVRDCSTGISMRFVKQFDIIVDRSPVRIDWVTKELYDELISSNRGE